MTITSHEIHSRPAAYASEPWPRRRYDAVVALSRSGTTSEVLPDHPRHLTRSIVLQ